MNPIPLRVRAHLTVQDYGANIASVVTLVLDHVHPGNIGALPPSSEPLLSKARPPGLL